MIWPNEIYETNRWPIQVPVQAREWPLRGLAISDEGVILVGDGRETQDGTAGLCLQGHMRGANPGDLATIVDLLGPARQQVEHYRMTGIAWCGGTWHVTGGKFYNVALADIPAQFRVEETQSGRVVSGPFPVGGIHNVKVGGYVCRGPGAWQVTMGGSVQQSQSLRSHGPSAHIVNVLDGVATLDRTILEYPQDCQPIANDKADAIMYGLKPYRTRLPDYTPADEWNAAEWFGNQLLVFGRKGLGKPYYGEPRPGDLKQSKGHHADPYENRVMSYTWDDRRRPWEQIPDWVSPITFGSGPITGSARWRNHLYLLQSGPEDGHDDAMLREFVVMDVA